MVSNIEKELMEGSPPAISVFLSYVRDDDDMFGFAGPLKRMIEQTFNSISSRPARVFLDRQDIALGDDWRRKIEDGVRSSMIFVPVYTLNYGRSRSCREEYLLFKEESESLGLSKLIIPVVLFGFKNLPPEGQDAIADYVRSHQSVDFCDAHLGGPESKEFRKSVLDISQRILDVSQSAEEELVQIEESRGGTVLQGDRSSPSVERDGRDGDDDEEDGLIELAEKFKHLAQAISNESEGMKSALSELAQAAKSVHGGESSMSSSKDVVILANKMKGPSEKLDACGVNILEHTVGADRALRKLISVARDSGSPELVNEVASSVSSGVSSFEGIEYAASQIEGLLESMKVPEAMSASLRKALRPARRGVTNIRDAVNVLSEWRSLTSAFNV